MLEVEGEDVKHLIGLPFSKRDCGDGEMIRDDFGLKLRVLV